MPKRSCFFIGHADAPEEILPMLMEAIVQLVKQEGVEEFYFGNHGRFDSLARRALAGAKEQYPQIKRILVLAYHPAMISVPIPRDVDESLYPFDERVMPRYAISRANRKMIDMCDYLIAYVRHTGKSRDFLEYAERKRKRIHRI